MSNKPLPVQTEISATYWDGLKASKIILQQCNDCHHWIFYPRRHCDKCWSHDIESRQVSGSGTLYTYTVTRIPTLPDFADEMPQKMAVIELDEGVRINTTLVGVEEDEIKVGMTVKPVFETVNADGMTLLRFTSVGSDFPDRIDSSVVQLDEPEEVSPTRQIHFQDIEQMQTIVSDKFTDWSNQIVVDQLLIDEFAEISGDDYWIHTDPVRAEKEGPFGGTIAHGALIQILQSRLKLQMDFEVTGFTNMVNYGSNRLRFPSPVSAGSKIHAHSRVKSVEAVKHGTQITLEINIHVVGIERPSVINDLVILYM